MENPGNLGETNEIITAGSFDGFEQMALEDCGWDVLLCGFYAGLSKF